MRSLILALLAIVTLSLSWIGLVRLLPAPYETRWIHGIYQRKEESAGQIKAAKALIIGGSGTHFSYSGQTVSENTGWPVINFGTHAGLGVEYLLYRARQSLRPGDAAIVAIEHHLLDASGTTSILAPYVEIFDLGYLLYAPAREVPTLIFGYPPSHVLRELASSSMQWNSPLYRVEAVTSFGDESANTLENRLPRMLEVLRQEPPIAPMPRDPAQPPDSLVKFAEWAKDNDVCLFMAWPVTLDRDEYDAPVYDAYFDEHAAMYRRLGFDVLGRPDEYRLPEVMMLDSMYHATNAGAHYVSRQLAADLTAVGGLCRGLAPGAAGRQADDLPRRR